MKRAVWHVTLALVAAELSVGDALAQSTQWRTVPDRSRKFSDKDAQIELFAFSDCIVARRLKKAQEFVLLPYGSVEQENAFKLVVPRTDEDSCFTASFESVRMTIRAQVLAGAIAQALLRRHYSDFATVMRPAAFAAVPPTPAVLPAETFGRCVVESDPASVLAIVRSRPGSTDELVATGALKPYLSNCLAAGSELKINRTFLRNVIAVAGFRMANALSPRPMNGAR